MRLHETRVSNTKDLVSVTMCGLIYSIPTDGSKY